MRWLLVGGLGVLAYCIFVEPPKMLASRKDFTDWWRKTTGRVEPAPAGGETVDEPS